jgi:FkbM family methyltransferase
MSLLNTYRFITDAPQNQGHRTSAFVRFAKWQVGSRLVPGRVVHDWVNGSQFLVGQGERGLTGNIYNGLHEFEDMGSLLHFLRPADLFVDVGANAGSFTILASSVTGARTVAFEPIPSTFERLEENVRLNDIEALVTCVNGGVAATEGRITFTTGDDAMNHVAAPGAETDTGMSVEVTTLDTALHGEDPALIKIDVEGFELPVLEGATRTIERPGLRAVIAELNG